MNFIRISSNQANGFTNSAELCFVKDAESTPLCGICEKH